MAEVKSELNLIKIDAGTKIFRRGENYYQQGRVEEFEVEEEPGREFDYTVRARVVGTHLYFTTVKIKMTPFGPRIVENSCSCPYTMSDICKHAVAVAYRFTLEEYNSLQKEEEESDAYSRLLSLADFSQEPVEITYHVRGLINDQLANFRLRIGGQGLSSEELEVIVKYINGEDRNPMFLEFHRFSQDRMTYRALKERIPPEHQTVIEMLRQMEPSKSRIDGAVLIHKNAPSFHFILHIVRNYEVYLDETDEHLVIGEPVLPRLKLTGSEDEIKIKEVETGEEIHRITGSDGYAAWIIREGTLHPIYKRIDNLAGRSMKLPEERKGEFIFDVLPRLEEKLEIDESFPDYERREIVPDVELDLDYSEDTVCCWARVRWDLGDREEILTGNQILEPEERNDRYFRSKTDSKVWYRADRGPLRQLIGFLEDSEFLVSGNRFLLRNPDHIQQFIAEGIETIPDAWKVKTSEAYDELEIIPAELNPTVEIMTGDQAGGEEELTADQEEDEDWNEGIDWFDFQITYSLNGETFTHDEIMKMLKTRADGERYLQLGGKFYQLETTEEEKTVDRLMREAEKEDEGGYRSRYYNLLYYQKLLSDRGIDVNGDQTFKELAGESPIEIEEPPGDLQDVMRDYQLEGYHWLRFLYRYRFGGILADDMGLGKTLQALSLIASLKERSDTMAPAVVICPRSLIHGWAEEARKFLSQLDYLVYHANPEERDAMREKFPEKDLVITTYSTFARDIEYMKEQTFSCCILDEAQKIKNHRTKRARAVKSLRVPFRLALTGTPIENSIEELWSIFDFLMPGYLENYATFRKDYELPIKNENDSERLTELKERVAPFILRRTKKEVLTELPEKTEIIKRVQLTKLQQDTYSTILAQVKSDVFQTVETKGFNKSRINVLAALTRLRQICDHPGLVLDSGEDDFEESDSGKIRGLMELVEEAVSSGHKLIVFSQFVQMLKIIAGEFDNQELAYEYLDGSTTNRMERINRFNDDPSIPAFLISLKAGGLGLNLTAADIVIHVDPWWNPMVERQASDRVHRIGQSRKVFIYKLVTEGTVEEKMLKLQNRKRSLFNRIVEENKNPVKALNWEDIRELFTY